MENENLSENSLKIHFQGNLVPNVVFFQNFSDPDLPIYLFVATQTKMVYRFLLKNQTKNTFQVI